ncbi:COG1470 family protein [Actinokineospora bangkokensis]|uniref:Hydrolytic protein n=1 Tax=Actinokineospora bangkokensis TaxID=1193682 RepID=A0A1Q9LK07_9PSEU|nr:hypothetical protein [Actinokineospora bangkokensis]OLR92387.1 hypothetical protein BJP25_20075 [Actinokineospora bangkokensis]
MAVSALLRTTEVTVAPGGAGRCHVLIRNNSAVVDQFAFSVRGDVAEWTQVKPERVNLMPNQEVGVELTFSPPRSPQVLAGPHPFALRVASREDPGGSVVQEGVVSVERFTEVVAQVVPVTSTGRRRGRHTLAVDNLGNHAHGVEVTAADPDAKLTFRVKPRSPRLEPGTATFVRVKAKPRKYFWKGPDRSHPFGLTVLVPDGAPVEVEAAHTQQPLVPRRFFWLFSLLMALIIIVAVLVLALLRQQPTSIAGPAPTAKATSTSASPPTTPPATTTPAPPSAQPTAPPAAQPVGSDPLPVGGSGGSTRVPRTTTAVPVTGGFTIRASAAPGVQGGPQLFSYVVPDGARQRLLSLRLSGPAGDSGHLQVLHGDTPLGDYPLAALTGAGQQLRPDPAPLLSPGDVVTLAVECANPRELCTPQAVATTALVR